jgi:NAD(P)H-dependent FMN reductase
MGDRILVFYGSYRSDRMGIRLADYLVRGLAGRGNDVELIDARAIGLPILDRMYKEYPKGEAPAAMETLAGKIRNADAFLFVTGEYNWGPQPGLKNLTDHSSRNGSGGRQPSPATQPAASRASGPIMPGTARSPRWEWWSSLRH